MLDIDLHTHSLFSPCGLHSILEMLTQARENGMSGIAITDHGPLYGGRLPCTYFDRFMNPVRGTRLFKGVECNLDGDEGGIDMPRRYLPYCDVVLLGIHENVATGLGPARYTDLLIAALHANPEVCIVTHPNSVDFPVELPRLAHAAAQMHVALELNNSRTACGRVDDAVTCELIECCKREQCMLTISSDAHTINEVGDDSAVRPLLEKVGFPEHLIVNRTVSSTIDWLHRRRG